MRTENSRFGRFGLGTVAALALVVPLAGCNGTGGNSAGVFGTTPSAAEQANMVRVVATNFEFTPSTITVAPGETVEVQLVNEGSAPHNIEFELPQGEVELDQNVQPGNARTLTFTAPSEPGEYRFYCPVGNHAERGMVGTLIVREGAAQ